MMRINNWTCLRRPSIKLELPSIMTCPLRRDWDEDDHQHYSLQLYFSDLWGDLDLPYVCHLKPTSEEALFNFCCWMA
ncbi:hypothetical protein OPV22_031592 [Ensete ventricosum]|uniref:Uncharacterized protein n=1 Tax=Ensete ventricosum TaxID=4639 RepID=A0AAV8NZF1_ENSVE|nr:hypothetical protein OPV22_031592 [Ensete ventricosum]